MSFFVLKNLIVFIAFICVKLYPNSSVALLLFAMFIEFCYAYIITTYSYKSLYEQFKSLLDRSVYQLEKMLNQEKDLIKNIEEITSLNTVYKVMVIKLTKQIEGLTGESFKSQMKKLEQELLNEPKTNN